MAQLRVCKLSEISVPGKTISGSEACRPGRPARLTIDKFKLHYFVHYMHRGEWDELVPEEKEEDLGKIEAYWCNFDGCGRRFRNNHDKKSYPGRGSIMCHLAAEHGQLIKAMKADTVVDMTDEIAAIDEHEKGAFEKGEDPEIPDNGMYTARENFMWKFQNQKKNDENNSGSNNGPRIVPLSRSEMANGVTGDGPRRPKVFECPHCNECKNNMDPSRLRLHVFHHYKDRWEHRLDPLERGPNYFYCNMCPKRKQIKGANEEGARMSTICHFAIQHHELRDVLNRDERLPENFVSDLYYDIDLKEGKLDQNKPTEKTTPASAKPEPAKPDASQVAKEQLKQLTESSKKNSKANKKVEQDKDNDANKAKEQLKQLTESSKKSSKGNKKAGKSSELPETAPREDDDDEARTAREQLRQLMESSKKSKSKKSTETKKAAETKKAPEPVKATPEPTRGKRPKNPPKSKSDWLSSDDEHEEPVKLAPAKSKVVKSPVKSAPVKAPSAKKSRK